MPVDNRLHCLMAAIREWDQSRSALPPTYGTRSGQLPAVRHSARSWGRRRFRHCRRHCRQCRCWKRVPCCRRLHPRMRIRCPHCRPVEDQSQHNRWIRRSTCSRRCLCSSREFRPTSTSHTPPGARPGTTDSPSHSSNGASSHRASIHRPNTGDASHSRPDPSRTRKPGARHKPCGRYSPDDPRNRCDTR